MAKRDAAFAKAENASGTEKAKLLAEGLSLVDDEMALKTYGNVVSQIIELDADNKAGLKAKFAGLKDSVGFKSELEATMRGNSSKPEDTLAAIDKLIEEKKPTGAALQEAVFMKSSILFQTDKAKAKEMLLEGAEARAEKRDRQADRWHPRALLQGRVKATLGQDAKKHTRLGCAFSRLGTSPPSHFSAEKALTGRGLQGVIPAT